MKSFFIKSAALAALTVISAVSCTKEQNVDASVSQPELHFIIKTAENTPVKSFIENNLDGTYTPKWTNGDQLAIFIGTISDKTSSTTATLSNTAITGTTAKFEGTVPTGLTEGTFLSFSPAGAFEKGYTDGIVGINLSKIQSPRSLTIDEACDVLVARPCDFLAENGNVAINDLFFKRIFSIVKVNLKGVEALKGEKVTSFTLNAPVTLTGCAAVDLSTASFSKWNVENKSVTANYSEDWPVFGGVNGLKNTIWLVVNPTTVAKGSTVTFSGETENYTFSKDVTLSKELTFPQSQMAVINLTIGEGNYTKKVYSWDLSVNSTSEATAYKISWSNSVAEMVCVKGESDTDTNANNYYPGAGQSSTRFYKNSTLTITPKEGKKLTYYIFKATTENYASALSKSTWTNAQVTVDGTTVSVIADNPSSEVSCKISATCGFTKVECHTDAVPVFPPSISVTAASIEVPADEGNHTIKYTVKNPVDGKSISATSNKTWVKDFNYSTSGQVSFVVEKNAGEERTASIKLSYEGAEDVTVSVTQAAAGSGTEQTWTWTAASGDLGTKTPYSATLNKKAWSVTRSKVVHTAFTSNCIQLGSSSGAETVTLTSNAFSGTIKSVSVECSSYNAAHKVDITVGGTSYKSGVSTAKWTTVGTVSGTGTSSGAIVIKFTAGSRALYIKSISVTYAASGSTGGGETGGGETGGGETGGGESGNSFNKLTSSLTDYSGEYLMLHSNDYVVSGVSSNHLSAVSLNPTVGDQILVSSVPESAAVLTIAESTTSGYYTIKLPNGNYLGWPSSTDFSTNTTANTDNYLWSISITNSSATISNKNDKTRIIKWYASKKEFRPYTTQSYDLPVLYKKN